MINFEIQDNRIHFGGLELDKPTKEGQKAGIAVLEGLKARIQKKLGLAEDIKTSGGGIYTINKKSRNKWLARTSHFTAFSGQKLGTRTTGHFSNSHKKINEAFHKAVGHDSKAICTFLVNHARIFDEKRLNFQGEKFSTENLEKYFREEDQIITTLENSLIPVTSNDDEPINNHIDLNEEFKNQFEAKPRFYENSPLSNLEARLKEKNKDLLEGIYKEKEIVSRVAEAISQKVITDAILEAKTQKKADKKALEAMQIVPFNKAFAKAQLALAKKAATKIQAVFRGMLARKALCHKVHEEKLSKVHKQLRKFHEILQNQLEAKKVRDDIYQPSSEFPMTTENKKSLTSRVSSFLYEVFLG